MNKLTVRKINNPKYHSIVTFLDYEVKTTEYLEKLKFDMSNNQPDKILVDLALVTGINRYRFVEFTLDRNGCVITPYYRYVESTGCIDDVMLIDAANNILREHADIVKNSILTDTQKQKLLMNNVSAATILKNRLSDVKDENCKEALKLAIKSLYLDALDDWHKSDTNISAIDYLGLTQEEYTYWLLGIPA